jgi:hypothetical protein
MKGILRPPHVCFILRHSSNWNPHRLHPEPFPPKENHNVGPLRFNDDHDHICFSLRRFEYLAERSNVGRSLQHETFFTFVIGIKSVIF